MKTNFKKTLAVFLAVLMLTSAFSVTAFAATYTGQILPGTAEGVTLKDGITEDMLTITSSSTRAKLPGEAYFEREDYVQDGWTTTASGAGTLLKFGSSQTINKKKFYPHWKQVVFTLTFTVGNAYDTTDPNNFADAEMTQPKEYKVKTDGTSAQPVVLPDAMFTREGYVQTGWTTTKGGTGTKLAFGSTYTGSITKNITLYPYWEAVNYVVRFDPGAYGTGTAQEQEVAFGKTVTAPGEIFDREGYALIGWATTDNATEVELELNATSPKIEGDITYYPVWLKAVYDISVSENTFQYGIKCIGYSPIAEQTVTITNEGNVTLSYTIPTSANYEITIQSGSADLKPGASLVLTIKPYDNLPVANYTEALSFVCGEASVCFDIDVSFRVVNHSYSTYKSCGDATYQADGYKEATCLNGCGTVDRIIDAGSMKEVGAEYNDAQGIADSYVHHRTVRFVAYGSGMDDTENYVTTRFRPVSWYVDDTYNGEFTDNEFENGYEVAFTHTIFGEYTLTINYVEETKDATTGEWVVTGETDTKTFEYTVGTTAEEEQEIVRPNTILNIIFGLFAELLKLLGLGG